MIVFFMNHPPLLHPPISYIEKCIWTSYMDKLYGKVYNICA